MSTLKAQINQIRECIKDLEHERLRIEPGTMQHTYTGERVEVLEDAIKTIETVKQLKALVKVLVEIQD